jgi:pimeloyl-ACP methyl ester carboxylesterase
VSEGGFADAPDRIIAARDGTRIAVFSMGSPTVGTRPLLLVHGTSGDHRTWRVAGPMLARRRLLAAIDRRGRGDSGDAPDWSIEREVEDVAAAAEALAADGGGPVDVLGHSLGGRLSLAASLATPAIRRVVAYEAMASASAAERGLVAALRERLDASDLGGLLATFMTEAVGMPADELAAFRANPIWPLRAAAGPTIVRELEAALSAPALGIDALAEVRVPVLQLVGSGSPSWFADGARALDARLADGRLEVIEGARHGAHHSHAAEFTTRVEAFLDA